MSNRLAEATSPYLLQHKDNPVDWQPWDAAALARARAEDKPILLSVGYAACHWCHVMEHESFENESIAGLMNEHFVSIKVDREERPDLDGIYQHALALLGQQGGWPLTMFLTPDGKPFWGGTYFPPESRYGRPGFPEVLTTVARIWREERDKVEGNREQIERALARLGIPEPADRLPADLGIRAARALLQELDTVHGGLGAAPKFPQAPILDLMWRAALRTGDESLRHAVLYTLARICQGGIYDHLGGGFARYAVDAMWLVPHFEKMLYDNAQLLRLLAHAHAETGNPLFRGRALETVAWLEREMVVEEGGLASALDADSEGEEGIFYVWDAAEIDSLLGDDAHAFKLAYGVKPSGNWEGRNVLNRLHEPGLRDDEAERGLARMRAILLDARERRPRPARDDKVLADWNGLAIAALAEAGMMLERPGWVRLGQRAFDFVRDRLGDGDRLRHSYRAGRRMDRAFLDDYAQMSRAALALYEATGEAHHLQQARRWVEAATADLADAAGGFHLAPASPDLLVRTKNAHDGPSPAANGTMAEVLVRLHHQTGEQRFLDQALATLRAFAGDAQKNPFVHTALLGAAMLLERPIQVAVIGEPEARAPLLQAAFRPSVPDRILMALAPDAALPEGHPAAGKTAHPAAYVCIGPVCRAPVAEPQQLEHALSPSELRHG
jgi:uncharacterized protein